MKILEILRWINIIIFKVNVLGKCKCDNDDRIEFANVIQSMKQIENGKWNFTQKPLSLFGSLPTYKGIFWGLMMN